MANFCMGLHILALCGIFIACAIMFGRYLFVMGWHFLDMGLNVWVLCGMVWDSIFGHYVAFFVLG